MPSEKKKRKRSAKRGPYNDKLKIDLPFEDAVKAALEIQPTTKKDRKGRSQAKRGGAEAQGSQHAIRREGPPG